MKKIQVGISLSAIIIAIIHITRPDLSIDAITLALFIVAIIPWLAPFLKSLEFPGGWKVEFKEFEDITDKADKAGLLSNEAELSDNHQFSYQSIANNEPYLVLAGLRIEIETILKKIAVNRGIKGHNRPLKWHLSALSKNNIITVEERKALQDLIALLNRSIHGLEVDEREAQWAIDFGPRILRTLDDKLTK